VRRIPRYAFAWAATTALAVTVSWFAVEAALDRAVGRFDTAPVAVDGRPGTRVVKVPAVTPAPTPTSAAPHTGHPDAPVLTPSRPGRGAGPAGSTSSTPTVPGALTDPGTTPTSPPPPRPAGRQGPASPTPGATSPSAPSKTNAEVYRVDAAGGSAWISYAPGDVHVVDYIVAHGYRLVVEQRQPDWVVVRCTAARAESVISARWFNGAYAEVTDKGW